MRDKTPEIRQEVHIGNERSVGVASLEAEDLEALIDLRLRLATQEVEIRRGEDEKATAWAEEVHQSHEEAISKRVYWEEQLRKIRAAKESNHSTGGVTVNVHGNPDAESLSQAVQQALDTRVRYVKSQGEDYVDFTNMAGTEVIKDAVKDAIVEQEAEKDLSPSEKRWESEEPPQEDLFGHLGDER